MAPPAKKKCSGCKENIEDRRFLQCSKCSRLYDLLCANVPETRFYSTMTEDHKKKWICQLCKSQQPKGDNTDSPARTGRDDDNFSESENNVTFRKNSNVKICPCISADEIRKIFRAEFQSSMRQITEGNITQLQEMKKVIAEFKASITFFNEQFEEMKNEASIQKTIVENLQKENEQLKTNNLEITAKLRTLDQQMRAANVEIHCVPEFKTESLISTVKQLGNVINHPVQDTDLQYCSRIAKLNPANSRPRVILVKFSSPRFKESFHKAAIQYNKNNPSNRLNTGHLGIAEEKKSAIFIAEHLTPENKQLHAAARAKAKELNYRFVWVRNGRIYIRKNEESSHIPVLNKSVLDNLAV